MSKQEHQNGRRLTRGFLEDQKVTKELYFCRNPSCHGNQNRYRNGSAQGKGYLSEGRLKQHIKSNEQCLHVYRTQGLISHPGGDGQPVYDLSTSTETTYFQKVPPPSSTSPPSPSSTASPPIESCMSPLSSYEETEEPPLKRKKKNSKEGIKTSSEYSKMKHRRYSLPSLINKYGITEFYARKKGDSGDSKFYNPTPFLNKQVIYDATQPQLTKQLLQDLISCLEEYHEVASPTVTTENNNQDNHSTTNLPADAAQDESDSSLQEGEDNLNNTLLNVNPNIPTEDHGPVIVPLINQTETVSNVLNSRFVYEIRHGIAHPQASSQLATEIELLNILNQHKMPLAAFNTIMKWAKKSASRSNFNFKDLKHIRSRETILKETSKRLGIQPFHEAFKPRIVEWLPDNRPTVIFVRNFIDAVMALLTNSNIFVEENLSFPNQEDPTSPIANPEPTPNQMITELHHGKWWTETMNRNCAQDKNEVLVPVILYQDGIVIDQNGLLSLTPMNLSLGIFNTETRTLPEAWELIYFHPDASHEKSLHSREPTPKESLENLHRTIEAALESLQNYMQSSNGIQFDYLPYAGKIWKVRLKFSIAFFIGDTEHHDKLCGRYLPRNRNIKMICRHCDCPTEFCVDPTKQAETTLFRPSDLHPTNEELIPGYFQSISHHPIQNAFHNLDFGSNENNIHLATPGECLHMHQLGVAKRMIEAFRFLVRGNVEDDFGPTSKHKKKKVKDTLDFITMLAQKFGGQLSRQSDRDFPRTKFGSSILVTTKKEGHEYAGMLLGLLVALVSDRGKEILFTERGMDENRIIDQVHMIELILGMEEWLKKGQPTRVQLTFLPAAIDDFIEKINFNCQRSGMGTMLIKNHLYFHIPKYIEMWGPPKGWNSAPNESHHKTEVKAPSKNTQKRPTTIAHQTTRRYYEQRILRKAKHHWHLGMPDTLSVGSDRKKIGLCGSRCRIKADGVMEWLDSRNKDNPEFPQIILEVVAKEVLPVVACDHVIGFTEYRCIPTVTGEECIFRASPAYRTDAGMVSGVWYDWAMFADHQEQIAIPGQILCFFETGILKPNQPTATFFKDHTSYAVIRKFEEAPKPILVAGNNNNSMDDSDQESSVSSPRFTELIQWGRLEDELFIVACDDIIDTCAVVPNTPCKKADSPVEQLGENAWLVVSNRAEWLEYFGTEHLLSFQDG